MLINLIEKLYLNNGYEYINIENNHDELIVKIFKPQTAEKKAEYHLVVECKNPTIQNAENLLLEWADDLHLKVRESPMIDRVFSKNSTMIICWPESSITKKQIFQLEEDRYNFKKNVICYSLKELADLNLKNSDFTLKQLNNFVGEGHGAYFQRFKEKSAELENYYTLVLKIFLKVPFVTYLHDTKNLFDLDLLLTADLSQSEQELYDFTQGIDQGLNDEDLMEEFLKREM